MSTAEQVDQVDQASHEESAPVTVEDAPGTVFDAVRAGTLTQDRFLNLMASASLRGVWSNLR